MFRLFFHPLLSLSIIAPLALGGCSGGDANGPSTEQCTDECGHMNIRWYLYTEFASMTSCQEANVSTVTISITPAGGEAETVELPCEDGAMLTPKLPLGPYSVSIEFQPIGPYSAPSPILVELTEPTEVRDCQMQLFLTAGRWTCS